MTASPPIITPSSSREREGRCAAAADCSSGVVGPGSNINEEQEEGEMMWVTKLESGVFTPADWQQLETEKDGLPWYSQSSTSSNPCLEEDDEKENDSSSTTTNKAPKFVRVRGFVQDMMDIEYLQQDSSPCGGSMVDVASSWTERTPLVVSQIPYTSPWFQRSLSRNNNSNNNGNGQDGGEPTTKKQKLRHSNSLGGEADVVVDEVNAKGDDEKNSEAQYEPLVLAKFYYDQYAGSAKNKKLQLNDIVEMVGVIEYHDTNNDETAADDDDAHMMMTDEESWWENNFNNKGAALLPTHLPRFHVVWYKAIDLDTLVAEEYYASSSSRALLPAPTAQPGKVLAKELKVNEAGGTALWMTLLSMAERKAVSPEEENHDRRQQPPNNNEDGGHHHQQQQQWTAPAVPTVLNTTLGCASLNMILDNADACTAMQKDLTRTLSKIVPQVVAFDLSTMSSPPNNKTKTIMPSQSSGRLLPSTFQLPKGSTLILNAGNIKSYITSTLSKQVLAELQELAGSHKLAYTFGGGVKIPFEADIRIIVLTTEKSRKLFPCSLEVKCNSNNNSTDSADDSMNVDESNDPSPLATTSSLVGVRNALAMARMSPAAMRKAKINTNNNYNNNTKAQQQLSCNNIGLSRAVLEQAQNDFIARRSAAREMTTTASTAHHQQQQRQIVTETDFHRWLTITRLQARSRMSQTAELQDWERALEMDDALVASFSG